MSVKSKLHKLSKEAKIRKEAPEPVWKGPEVDGVTQSMLNDFLFCRERFRVKTIVGLKPADRFSKGIEYGNMWHICEECHAVNEDYDKKLKNYVQSLHAKYPLDREEITKWYHVCKLQFPVYVEYWEDHQDVIDRKPILQEETFKIPYKLPSGRIVYLRGKFDSVDLIGKGKESGVYLQENKTKGDVDEIKLQRQLTFDLQTMFYLTALTERKVSSFPVKGVRYNVIRRPLSGGKGTIRRHQPSKSNPKGESEQEFYSRLLNDYIALEPETYFMRWTVNVTPSDLKKYQEEFLHPILEQLYWWYNFVSGKETWLGGTEDLIKALNYRTPFGIYNPISDGSGITDLDEYLASGSTVGLEPVKTLFPELEESELGE